MSTFQLDDNDAPVTTHVDMGDIIPPRMGPKTNDAVLPSTSADASSQTSGPTHGSKPAVAENCHTRPDNIQPKKRSDG